MHIRILSCSLRLFLLILVGSTFLFSQNQQPVRDAGAVAAIQTALGNMGVFQANITSCVVQGTYQAAAGSGQSDGTFAWEFAGSEFRIAGTSGAQTGVLVSGHGKPGISQNGSVISLPKHVGMAIMPPLPFLPLLNALVNANYSVQLIGPANVNGHQTVQIRTSLNTNPAASAVTPQDWYLDASTGLPAWVTFRMPDLHNPANVNIGAMGPSNYQNVNGVLVPMQIVAYNGTQQTGTFNIVSVSFNATIPNSDFDLAGGGE